MYLLSGTQTKTKTRRVPILKTDSMLLTIIIASDKQAVVRNTVGLFLDSRYVELVYQIRVITESDSSITV